MNQFTALTFKEWYKKVKGSSITFDFENQKLSVFDIKGEVIANLDFAKKIDAEFDLADLFNEDFKQEKFEYYVFPGEPLFSETLWRIKTVKC